MSRTCRAATDNTTRRLTVFRTGFLAFPDLGQFLRCQCVYFVDERENSPSSEVDGPFSGALTSEPTIAISGQVNILPPPWCVQGVSCSEIHAVVVHSLTPVRPGPPQFWWRRKDLRQWIAQQRGRVREFKVALMMCVKEGHGGRDIADDLEASLKLDNAPSLTYLGVWPQVRTAWPSVSCHPFSTCGAVRARQATQAPAALFSVVSRRKHAARPPHCRIVRTHAAWWLAPALASPCMHCMPRPP